MYVDEMNPGGRSAPSRRGRAAVLLAVLLGLAGCASNPYPEDKDPLEPTNRAMYAFNDALDKVLLEPVSDVYVAVTPRPVRAGVTNFFINLAYPGVVLNDLLQGKVDHAMSDTGRFLVNSTVGILGLFDPASDLGIERREEDFGQTLAVWGADEVAHLHLPLIGPNSVRDAPGLLVEGFTNLLYYFEGSVALPLTVLRVINERANRGTAMKIREQAALDPYLFTREAYRQRRRYLIHDGNPPRERFDDAGAMILLPLPPGDRDTPLPAGEAG
ncbi:MAG: VacJ family lipoprotein [Gammaproteobacteria bacterium]|nr:VacJ family lipoprotein [Gammaproteobacteria bacterium]